MKLSQTGERCIITDLSGIARFTVPKDIPEPDELAQEREQCKVNLPLPLTTPWRLIMVADTPGKLLEKNDIFLNLNDPCAICDTSFIKPGKAIREITLTTAGAKACIDFAVKHNIQYILFDCGWYGKEYSVDSDATSVDIDLQQNADPLDLKEVIKYGEENNVGVILYVNGVALERQLDEILSVYRSWGVKGIKFGFVKVGPQSCSSWIHEAIRKAAQYGFILTVHDEHRPTGYSRTYPNLLTVEGVCGDEVKQPASNTLATVFTRMLCGPADNTVCYYAPRVDEKWSHAFQLAKALVIFSPLLFLYWYDRPLLPNAALPEDMSYILSDEPELEFFDNLPTSWDDTRVLNGEIGKYIIMARRKGRDWYLGIMNASISRKFNFDLEFLNKGMQYAAYVYADDPWYKQGRI